MLNFSHLAVAGVILAGAAPAGSGATPLVSARAKAQLANLLTDEDYPAAALAAREQGVVEFALDVGEIGRVTACTVTRSSGSAHLDSATCRLMKSRARFTPALDSAGAPVADRVAGRIAWTLPPAAPAPAP